MRAIPQERQRHAFAVSEESGLIEPLTRAVLARLEDPSWPRVVERYVPRSR